MPTPTFEPIATYTLPSDTATYTFSNISQSYTHLYVVVNILSTSNGLDFYVRFNGDGGNNYATTKMGSSPSSRSTNRRDSAPAMQLFYVVSGASNGTWTGGEIWIPYYTSTTFTKNIQATGGGKSETGMSSSFWNNTAAITSIGFAATDTFTTSPTLGAGTTFTLYGILKA